MGQDDIQDSVLQLKKYNWRGLNKFQLGRYAEYFVKMEFTLLGFDVYVPEVDDRGIDFVIRKGDKKYYEIQVKSRRGLKPIILKKSKFALRSNLLAAVVIFYWGLPPDLYLIPSKEWDLFKSLRSGTGKLFRGFSMQVEGKATWRLNLSRRNEHMLE